MLERHLDQWSATHVTLFGFDNHAFLFFSTFFALRSVMNTFRGYIPLSILPSLYSLVHSLRQSVFFLSTKGFNNYSDFFKYSAHYEAHVFSRALFCRSALLKHYSTSLELCVFLEYVLVPSAVSTTRRALS